MKHLKNFVPIALMAVGLMAVVYDAAGYLRFGEDVPWDLVALVSGAVFLISVGILIALLRGKGRKP